MSVAEMKIKVVQQVFDLNDQKLLEDVSNYLNLLHEKQEKESISAADKIFQIADKQYGEVLRKLAQ